MLLFPCPDSPTNHDEFRQKKGLRPGGFGLLMTKASVDELFTTKRRTK